MNASFLAPASYLLKRALVVSALSMAWPNAFAQECPRIPAASAPMVGLMAHVSGVSLPPAIEEAGHMGEYAVMVFSIGNALQPYGVKTALAPPQKDIDWVLKNKPKPVDDNSWPVEAGQGIEAGLLKTVFTEDAVIAKLPNVPGLHLKDHVLAQNSPQRVLKSVLLAIRPSGKTTLALGLGKPLFDVALYNYADNTLLWQCRVPGKALVVYSPGRIFEPSQERGRAYNVMPELMPLLQEAGYLGPLSSRGGPKAFAWPP